MIAAVDELRSASCAVPPMAWPEGPMIQVGPYCAPTARICSNVAYVRVVTVETVGTEGIQMIHSFVLGNHLYWDCR